VPRLCGAQCIRLCGVQLPAASSQACCWPHHRLELPILPLLVAAATTFFPYWHHQHAHYSLLPVLSLLLLTHTPPYLPPHVPAMADAHPDARSGMPCGKCYEMRCRNADFTDGYVSRQIQALASSQGCHFNKEPSSVGACTPHLQGQKLSRSSVCHDEWWVV
jgi:hypothetical protein